MEATTIYSAYSKTSIAIRERPGPNGHATSNALPITNLATMARIPDKPDRNQGLAGTEPQGRGAWRSLRYQGMNALDRSRQARLSQLRSIRSWIASRRPATRKRLHRQQRSRHGSDGRRPGRQSACAGGHGSTGLGSLTIPKPWHAEHLERLCRGPNQQTGKQRLCLPATARLPSAR